MESLTKKTAFQEIAEIVAGKFRPKLLTLEEHIRTLEKEKRGILERLERETEWHGTALDDKNEQIHALQERVAELVPRPPKHRHDPDEPRPVLTFDLDGTIKPQVAQGDGGNYPILEDPFPKVKKWLDRWSGRGACMHIATAGLYYGGRQDLEVYNARLEQIQAWIHKYSLPFELFLPKVPADVYYDDRMISVPGADTGKQQSIPDWDELGEIAEEQMARRFKMEAGLWTRLPKKRVGDEIEDWPDIEQYPKDRPRGYSGPRLDVDLHRTLSLASSSLREAEPRPDAREIIQEYFDLGVTIRISCAGWNPKTHSRDDSERRLAGIRRWLLENGIPYDRVVTKDHADLYFDDKGVTWTGWKADKPLIMSKLPKYEAYRHGD